MRLSMTRRLPQPTQVFDTYWRFAAERQRIFRARLRGDEPPLTDDTILAAFKFTNAYRASDRTSQFLIREVIYDRPRQFHEVFARVMLFKLFNRIETWELLSESFDEINAEVVTNAGLEKTLSDAMDRGRKLYSAAYIMPSPSSFGARRKHVNHLRLLRAMLEGNAANRILQCKAMGEAFEILLSYASIGRFLAYQLITDLNYSEHLGFAEDEFVEPGPGALDGISKCFDDLGDLTPPDVIRWTMETQSAEFERRGIRFDDLWGRPLQLIDCQNLYCEVSKYARVAHPETTGHSRRTRVKQRFRPRHEPLTAWYPPKWGVNTAVTKWLERRPEHIRIIQPKLFSQ